MTEKSDVEKAAEAKEEAKKAKEAKDKANAYDPEEAKKDNIKPLDDLDVAFLKSYVRSIHPPRMFGPNHDTSLH
jgi:hypothetical protein